MKIAVSANGHTSENLVSETFEKSACLLIVETDDGSYEVYPNSEDHNSFGMAMIQKIIENDCEALISGSIEEPAFNALVAAQVTRYFGASHRVIDALNLMESYQLDIIRVPSGEEWVPDNHEHDKCDCGID